jgi:hypothetical protein
VLVSVAAGGGAYLVTAVIMANHDRRVGRRPRMRPPPRPW